MCLVCKELQIIATPHLYRHMMFAGHVFDSSNFSATLEFLKWKTQSIRVKTIRIVHYAANNEDFKYDEKRVMAIFRLLTAIPSGSLTHFECVLLQAQQ